MAEGVEGVGGSVGGNNARGLSMDRVVPRETVHIVKGEEGIIDGPVHDVGVVLEGVAANEAADLAKAVCSNLDSRG